MLVTTAAQMVVAMANIVLPTIAPKVAETLAVDPVLVGYHVGLTFGAATVASIYAGVAVPRWGAALTTQLSMVFCVIGLALCALPHVAFIALGSIAIGAGMGYASPAAAHLLVRHTAPERRNLMFSIKQTGVPLGGVIVSLLAPALAVTVGWHWALAVIAATAIATLLLTQRARAFWDSDRNPAGSSARREPFGGVPLVWRQESLRWIALAAVLFSAVQRILLSFTVIYLVAEGGYGLVEAGIMLSVAQVGGSITRIPWGWLADRLQSGLAVLTHHLRDHDPVLDRAGRARPGLAEAAGVLPVLRARRKLPRLERHRPCRVLAPEPAGHGEPGCRRHLVLHLRRGDGRPAAVCPDVRRDRQLRHDVRPDGGDGRGGHGFSAARPPARTVTGDS